MSPIAITGISGFVGRHLALRLGADGQVVRGLVRPGTDPGRVPAGVDAQTGDIRSLETLRSLLDGCDAVIHLAASTSPLDNTGEIIVDGTRNVVTAAGDAGVSRIVYMSCLGADAASRSPFYAAKWRAESLVRESAAPFVILRPSLVLGRGDGILQPLAEMVRALPVVPIPGRGQARHQPIDVDDLARCIETALRGDLDGETVSVGGPLFVTLRQIVDLVSGVLGTRKRKLLLPERWIGAVAPALPAVARDLFGGPRLAQLTQGVVASPGIVERAFGFTPQSPVTLLPDYLS